MTNQLQKLLELSDAEKQAKGVQHTSLEISQQPATWRETYALCQEQQAEIREFLQRAEAQDSNVFLVGAGSSDYIGRVLAPLLRRYWRREVSVVASTDLLLGIDRYLLPNRKYLWISVSRSGDSAEGVAVLKSALEKHSETRHLVITCNSAGKMAKLCAEHPENALALVLGDIVNDRGLAMTSSFSNMVVAGQYLAHIQDSDAYGEVLNCMAVIGERFLGEMSQVASFVAENEFPRACFVGSGALAGVADECALKLLELTGGRVHTMSQSTLGLRHGPMTAIDEKTLFVQFLSNDWGNRRYELDLLEEVGTKKLAGARLVVDGQRGKIAGSAEYVLSLDLPQYFHDDCRAALDVMTGQLLGLFASLRSGIQPDNPSPSGTINRVVSGVTVYD